MAATTSFITEEGSVKDTRGKVHWMLLTAIGATIGDLWVIKDGGIDGTIKTKGSILAAQGTWYFPFVIRPGDPGIVCESSIYFSTNAAAGKFVVTFGLE